MAEFTSTVPATESYTITPSDESDLAKNARALRVDGGGDLKFTTIKDITDTWTVLDGEILPIQVKRVWDTGTTATGIHALV